MDKSASSQSLAPISSHFSRVLRALGASQNITETVALYAGLAEKMRQRNVSYLSLPEALSPLAADALYQEALPWGRGFFFDQQHVIDEKGEVDRLPLPYERSEILEMVKGYLSLDDLRVTVRVSLAWRVGIAVGWLSGVAVAQRDDAQAAMVALSVLVAPLLAHGSHQVVSCPAPARRLRTGRK